MNLFFKILSSERGSVGIGTIIAAGTTAAVGAAAAAGVNELLSSDPEQAQLLDSTNQNQLGTSYQNNLDAIQKQQNFTTGLTAAGNQGVAAQQQLLSQLQDQAEGKGPNPAQAALANATGANVANTAANIAGARGAGTNAGLAARNAANAGAQIQQDAAGQAAALQAQQQLAAQQQVGALATQQVNQQGQAIGNLNTATANARNAELSGAAAVNNARLGNATAVNNANSPMQNAVAGAAGDLIKSTTKGVGSLFLSEGGAVPGKSLVPGDSEENDVVPTLLSPGEIVIPRSFASDPKSAAAFAHACALFSGKEGK